MIEDFRTHLEALDGHLHQVATLDDARSKATELIGLGTVARWDDEILEGIDAPDTDPAQADVSLIVADVAVADTGAIGFAHGPGRSRAAGLLPDRQVVLLDRANLVLSMAEALARWFSNGEARAANVIFAAGPSRTADIEQKMMLGVHAPRSLDIVMYG